MNLTALIASARGYLQDPAPGVRWTDAEITAWLNEALDDFAIKTGATQTDATLTVNAKTPANAFWTLPADLVSLTRVRADGVELPMLSLEYVECNDTWEADTGTPDGYLYGPWGQSVLRIWPYKAATVKVWYTAQPTQLASGSDTPSILGIYHNRLVYGAVARAYQKDFDYKDPNKSAFFQSKFDEGVALAVSNMPSQPVSVPYRWL